MNIKNATYRRFGLTFPDEFPEDGERLTGRERMGLRSREWIAKDCIDFSPAGT